MNVVLSNKLQFYSRLVEVLIITGMKTFKKTRQITLISPCEPEIAINDVIHPVLQV